MWYVHTLWLKSYCKCPNQYGVRFWVFLFCDSHTYIHAAVCLSLSSEWLSLSESSQISTWTQGWREKILFWPEFENPTIQFLDQQHYKKKTIIRSIKVRASTLYLSAHFVYPSFYQCKVDLACILFYNQCHASHSLSLALIHLKLPNTTGVLCSWRLMCAFNYFQRFKPATILVTCPREVLGIKQKLREMIFVESN